MEKQAHEQLIQQQQALKCPRCHSSNTKFCYYNNYSLSQPRYFCKACKRYWTRGGTLRNVPIGGGCRKNKKVKKAAVATAAIDCTSPSLSAPVTMTSTNPSSSQFRIDSINSLFYGLNSNISSSDRLNISFQRNNSRVDTDSVYGYNLQKNLLGFSSPRQMANDDIITPKSFLSDYVTTPIFGSSNSGVSPSQTMASLISAYFNGLEPEKSISHQDKLFGITTNYADMQMQVVNKLNQVEASNEQNSLLSVGANWFDPSNFGSSVLL